MFHKVCIFLFLIFVYLCFRSKQRKRLDSNSKIAITSEEENVSKDKINIDPEEEKRKEAERFLQQKFKTFDKYYNDVCALLDTWDRSQGTIYKPTSPFENKSDHDEPALNTQNRKGQKPSISKKTFKF